jgi:integrase
VCESTNVFDWTPHDLRRTASTIMGRIEVPRFIIDRVLNHTDATTGGIYDRFTYTDGRWKRCPPGQHRGNQRHCQIVLREAS